TEPDRRGSLASDYQASLVMQLDVSRASVRRHRRAQGGSPIRRSITPTRARRPFDASVDHTDARNSLRRRAQAPTKRMIWSMIDWSAIGLAVHGVGSLVTIGATNRLPGGHSLPPPSRGPITARRLALSVESKTEAGT